MRIGILETGAPPGDLAEHYGRYDAMFRDLLGSGFETTTFKVNKGFLPGADDTSDAYLATGSPAGVYDDLPWIEPLAQFLRGVRGQKKLVGICFGHQMLAQAFGGKVVKSTKGWGVGLHRYQVSHPEPWMGQAPAEIALPASHQDQVVALPPGARVIVRSDFTPFAGLDYGGEAISFQGHPEFAPDYARALLVERRGTVPEAIADRAIQSLAAPNDNARVGRWIGGFLQA